MRKYSYQRLTILVKLYLICIYLFMTTRPTEQMHYFTKEDCMDDVEDNPVCGEATSLAFHYNFITKTCEKVLYRGCSPTKNHFDTLAECNTLALGTCSTTKIFREEDCRQTPQQCGFGIPRGFQFDVKLNVCQPVVMGDCSESTNYFKTIHDCYRITHLVCHTSMHEDDVYKITEPIPNNTSSPIHLDYSDDLDGITHSVNNISTEKSGDVDKVTQTVPNKTNSTIHLDYSDDSDEITHSVNYISTEKNTDVNKITQTVPNKKNVTIDSDYSNDSDVITHSVNHISTQKIGNVDKVTPTVLNKTNVTIHLDYSDDSDGITHSVNHISTEKNSDVDEVITNRPIHLDYLDYSDRTTNSENHCSTEKNSDMDTRTETARPAITDNPKDLDDSNYWGDSKYTNEDQDSNSDDSIYY